MVHFIPLFSNISDSWQWITTHPHLLWIGGVILAIVYVNQLVRELTGGIDLLKTTISFLKNLAAQIFGNEHIRAKYYNIVNSPEYIDWQYDTIIKIYKLDKESMERIYGEGNYICKVFGHEFLTACFEASDLNLYTKNENLTEFLDTDIEGRKKGLNEILTHAENLYRRQYDRILAGRLRRPNMLGYMLDTLSLDNKKITGFTAYVGTYGQNVYTSHILEYELYLAYTNRTLKRRIEKANIREEILESLPLRKKIHSGVETEKWLSTGKNRYSHLGVQAFVIFRSQGRYRAMMITRSDDVAAMPGYMQFIPSGGFEIYGSEGHVDKPLLEGQFSPSLALFRELLEEVFGYSEAECGDGRHIIGIEGHNKITRLRELINDGRASFEFLGAVTSMVSLRTELSFLIFIDDENYMSDLDTNYETDKTANQHFATLEELDRTVATMPDRHTGKLLSEHRDNMVNPPSAALYHLVKKSKTYQRIMGE